MNGHVITVVVITLSAVLTYLLSQPPGTIPQTVVLGLGALNVALTAISRFLPTANAPIQVEVTKQAEATPADGG